MGRHAHAAPPDDGHLGSFTRPEDTLDVTDDEGNPSLSIDTTRRTVSTMPGLTVALVVLALTVAILVSYCGAVTGFG